MATENEDDRIKLNLNPYPYIGQLTSVFIKTVDGNQKAVSTLGTATLIQPEELSVITQANKDD
jgi:hypothetical protein